MAHPLPDALSDADYTRFRSLILRRTGLDFPPPRRRDLSTGLYYVLSAPANGPHGTPPTSLDALYAALLADDEASWETVIDALTVCETHFFRNAPQFEALRDGVLPLLIAGKRANDQHHLRLWSAGCASGEEAYSLAILLRELLVDRVQWQLDITGTDINPRALAQARQGSYRDWSFREVSARHWQMVYFRKQGAQYHLRQDIRAMVQFRRCSLLDDCAAPPTARHDLILCRNVLLYLGTEVRPLIYRHLYRALVPGGWLVVGHADPPPTQFAPFLARSFSNVTFYQRPHTRPLTPPRPEASTTPAAPHLLDAPPGGVTTPDEDSATSADAQYRLGLWHANRQHWQQALDHCQRALALNPTHEGAHYTLALIHQSLDAPEAAIEALRRTIYLARDWPLPHFMLAGLLRERGDIARARRALRNVLALTDHLPPETPIAGVEGLTAARLRAAAQRQLDAAP